MLDVLKARKKPCRIFLAFLSDKGWILQENGRNLTTVENCPENKFMTTNIYGLILLIL